jgi:cell division protein FtsL
MRARFLALWTTAVFATAVSLIVHLTLRFETVRLGYDVGQARREQQKLVEARRLLSVEAATLTQPDRVETVARTVFGMDVPEAARIVPMGGRKQKPLSGKAQ